MSKFTRTQKILMGVIAFFIMFGAITKSMQNGNLIAKLGYDGFTMLNYALISHPAELVKNWMGDLAQLWYVQEENDELREELSKQKKYRLENEQLKRELAEKNALLDMIDRNAQYEPISANVIKRDAHGWNALITIDVGESDGIQADMAVVSADGMIGKVQDVNYKTSTVKLLTSEDRSERVSVRVSISDTESAEGILEYYDEAKGLFLIRLFTQNENVTKGMQVTTSGLGGLYPSGLSIGEIASVEEMDNQMGKTVFVTPAAKFDSFLYVAVLNDTEAN